MVTEMEKTASSRKSKPILQKGRSSLSFDLGLTKNAENNAQKIDELNSVRRRKSESISSRIIDDYLKEESKKELNKKEFEEAYQKVYGGNASPTTTTSWLNDSNLVKWPCSDYVEAARFFL